MGGSEIEEGIQVTGPLGQKEVDGWDIKEYDSKRHESEQGPRPLVINSRVDWGKSCLSLYPMTENIFRLLRGADMKMRRCWSLTMGTRKDRRGVRRKVRKVLKGLGLFIYR